MTPQIGSIYRWKGSDTDLDIGHYLVIDHTYDCDWLCIELETGRMDEFAFHNKNCQYWELCV